jgi:farnesyl-diphosphate farnesyltransferase
MCGEPAQEKSLLGTRLKQGAYGKVPIHKHSKISQLLRIDEVFAGLRLLSRPGSGKLKTVDLTSSKEAAALGPVFLTDVAFCDEILGKVSRSFASVIRELPAGLSLDVLIFYLVLRGLDTVEDDMEAFKGREGEKVAMLRSFHQAPLLEAGWKMQGVGDGDEARLLEQFYRCGNVFRTLPSASQEVIADITKRMGAGMADFVAQDLRQGTKDVESYNLYCHYVAGLVGEGLSRLFYARAYESEEVQNVARTLANTMGLFLQQTNILRDYLEDYVDGRAFWPEEVWGKYTQKPELGELATEGARTRAVHCLNHLVTDALECVPECLRYMSLLRTPEVFRFCAIPQIMAIATLRELYNNPKVFTGVVKIRKGLAAKILFSCSTVDELHCWFHRFAGEIAKIAASNPERTGPVSQRTVQLCAEIQSLTERSAWRAYRSRVLATLLPVGAAGCVLLQSPHLFDRFLRSNASLALVSGAAICACAQLSDFPTCYNKSK